MTASRGAFDFALDRIETYKGKADYYSLKKLGEQGHDIARLPFSIRVLLENSIRNSARVEGAAESAERLLDWPRTVNSELPFVPNRVLLQDYTGVPLIVDLAAMRDAFAKLGKDPRKVNSIAPADLVIDHSVQVDKWGDAIAFDYNVSREYERNRERYALLKWAQDSFENLRVFPPGKGICHQMNLEYLSSVVALEERNGRRVACPDSVVGTDSHTPMVNGIGVLGWGVGGLEAEAVMLGEPCHIPIPRVVGVRLTGRLREGVTTTDLVLAVTELLRARNVVDAFVEYFGEGYANLSVPERATLGNMSPEYGATAGFSPVDASTIAYLRQTGREEAHIRFVEEYSRLQGLFLTPESEERTFSEVLEVDMSGIEPSIAGPRNPEERRLLRSVPSLAKALIREASHKETRAAEGQLLFQERGPGAAGEGLGDGSIIIAAITSCTNTSNPSVMLGAGLLARNAVQRGLSPKPYVKCSLAPGSPVVKDYLEASGLLTYLDGLGFNLVGYGCTTCIGNSGPLLPAVERAIKEGDLYTVAVLSGNRNFDGRIHPLARGAFLMSPMLVVGYALAGRIDFDFYKEPLGRAKDGREVFLKDLWPSSAEIHEAAKSLGRRLYKDRYAEALSGDAQWESLVARPSATFGWDETSTYVQHPPWFEMRDGDAARAVRGARVLALLGDKVTTDHISPAGAIAADSPAGSYLMEHGVDIAHFSTYGSRRGNHEVMLRGGFSNPRLRNLLADGRTGGFTKHFPSNDVMTVYDASVRYAKEGVPLVILAGKQYGTGSSRDWAAKATRLLGVRAVVAESFERIHRANLVAMGVLPLEFTPGESAGSLGLKGDEEVDIEIPSDLAPGAVLPVSAKSGKKETRFKAKARIDSRAELNYYKSGGILPYVLREISGRPGR